MEIQAWLFFTVVCLLSLSQTALCKVGGRYNITAELEQYSDYNQFNQLLSRTGIDKEINKLGTATVLVVDDGAAGSLSSQSKETIKAVLQLHVIMDYLDKTKFSGWKKPSRTYLTNYQTTGEAINDRGSINVTKTGSENTEIRFGNGGQNAQLTANFEKYVQTTPPLSIIEISGLIEPSWVFNLKASSPKKAPSPSPSDAPAPSKRHRKEAPQSAESPDPESPPEPDADGGDDSPAPAPAGRNAASPSSSAPAAAFAVLVGLLAYTMAF